MLIKYQVPNKHDMFCPFCGNKIDDKAAFCPYCGSKISSVQPLGKQATPSPDAKISEEPVGSVSLDPPGGVPQPVQKSVQIEKKTWAIYYTFIVLLLLGMLLFFLGVLILSSISSILNDPQVQSTFQQVGRTTEELEQLLRIISYAFIIIGTISIGGVVGTFMLKPWGRILATIAFVIFVLSRNPMIIVLAIIGLYGIWFHKETKALFSGQSSPQWELK